VATSAYLVLSDGTVYRGRSFGASTESTGEVVFNTSMTGYQEMLTDPSYAGQILVPTYPMMGNYGINKEDDESAHIQVTGFVVKEHSERPSHYNSTRTIHEYLEAQGIPGISGVDTRAVTRRIRSSGVMMGAITTGDPQAAVEQLQASASYDSVDFVQSVSTHEAYAWGPTDAARRIAVVDCGVKYSILRSLSNRGCALRVFPATATLDEVMSFEPHGVLISPGPGDPVHNQATVETAKGLIGKLPLMGICLGHQVVSMALGAQIYKLKFGHRGGNHPVQDMETGRVYITAQNHGYAVSDEGLPLELVVTHRNINDGTIEGVRHRSAPVLTIQYHSEASPGPLDNEYIFDKFMEMVDGR
jgi:carbamoyl-phosphate synthase small subunit